VRCPLSEVLDGALSEVPCMVLCLVGLCRSVSWLWRTCPRSPWLASELRALCLSFSASVPLCLCLSDPLSLSL
jgi:hypothetical protein